MSQHKRKLIVMVFVLALALSMAVSPAMACDGGWPICPCPWC